MGSDITKYSYETKYELKYNCPSPNCNSIFDTSDEFQQHLQKDHPPTCPKCSKKFDSQVKLLQHFQEHDTKICEICNIKVEAKDLLDHFYKKHCCKHQHPHDERGRNLCPQCLNETYKLNPNIDTKRINIAIVGKTNSGKSTLHNTLCEFFGIPEAGGHKESGTEVEQQEPPTDIDYQVKDGSIPVTLWDIPGYSTIQPVEYIAKYGLRQMHAVMMVVTQEGCGPSDKAILQHLEYIGSDRAMLVVTHVDKMWEFDKSLQENVDVFHALQDDPVAARQNPISTIEEHLIYLSDLGRSPAIFGFVGRHPGNWAKGRGASKRQYPEMEGLRAYIEQLKFQLLQGLDDTVRGIIATCTMCRKVPPTFLCCPCNCRCLCNLCAGKVIQKVSSVHGINCPSCQKPVTGVQAVGI